MILFNLCIILHISTTTAVTVDHAELVGRYVSKVDTKVEWRVTESVGRTPCHVTSV